MVLVQLFTCGPLTVLLRVLICFDGVYNEPVNFQLGNSVPPGISQCLVSMAFQQLL